MKERFGKDVVFWGGGCDSQHVLPFASPDEVKADVRKNIEIFKPGEHIWGPSYYYIRVDRVNYSDGSQHDDFEGMNDPWPTEPDGGGKSLTRIVNGDYGNDPANWQVAVPSPDS